MKKLSLILIFVFLLTGCFKKGDLDGITIYTTTYPIEYITNYLYSDHSTIYSIYPNGIDVSDYELTDKQIKDYSKGELYIFNGLSIEKEYVSSMLKYNKRLKIIDTSSSMEANNGIEELWLDPSNFLMMASNIKSGFEEYIDNHYLQNDINEKYEQLKIEISNLDAKLVRLSETSDYQTIVVSSDLFKFLEKYNFNVISLEENDNLTDKTIENVKNLIRNKKIDYIFMKQNEEESKTIKNIKAETNVKTLKFNLLSNLTETDRTGKKDYISIMNENIELLKQELYD